MLGLVSGSLYLSVCMQERTSQGLTVCVCVYGFHIVEDAEDCRRGAVYIFIICIRWKGRYVRSAETRLWNLLAGSAIIMWRVKCCVCQKLLFIHVIKCVIQFCTWLATECTIIFSKSYGTSSAMADFLRYSAMLVWLHEALVMEFYWFVHHVVHYSLSADNESLCPYWIIVFSSITTIW